MTTLEENIAALEQALSASTDNDDEDQKRQIRMATVRQAAEEMSDEEKKEARAAMGEDHTHLKRQMKRAMGMEDEDERNRAMKKAMDMLDDKEKKAGEDEEDDDEKSGMEEDLDIRNKKDSSEDEDEKDKKIASLTASLNFMISKPFVDQMLKARQEAGMPPKELQKFKRSLYGKSIAEIKARHAEDKALYTKTLPKPLIAAEEPDNELMFNAGFNAQTPLSASTTSSESVEAMFD